MASQTRRPAGLEWLLRTLRPKRGVALRQYRFRAPRYDFQLILARPMRRLAIARLHLEGGETVLDVGCGTGLSLPLLEAGVGPRGKIIGLEESPEMLQQARKRVEKQGWRNVRFVHAPVEDAEIPVQADAALFCFTHDILRTPAAVANVFRHLRPGARVVAVGLKWAPEWDLPANLMVLSMALASTTALEGLRQPWSHLARWVSKLQVEDLAAATNFIATGIARRRGRAAA